MALFAIADLMENGKSIGKRLYDIESKGTKDVPNQAVLKVLSGNPSIIKNLEIVGNELAGIGGSLSRYAKVDARTGKLIAGKAVVIVKRITKAEDTVGFDVVNYKGESKRLRESDVATLELANGKVVERDGRKFVSSIYGEYVEEEIKVPEKNRGEESKKEVTAGAVGREAKPVEPVKMTSAAGDKDRERIKELVALLNKARAVYEQGEDEIMSNYEYDALYDELEGLEGRTGLIFADSPTQQVGYQVVSKLAKIQHDTPMLSLGKTKDINDLKSFLGERTGQLSWKLDGLTVVLTYENGVLKQAVTRGNGSIGEDVTNNAKTFVNVPKRIGVNEKIVLRGEALIDYGTFNKIKETPEGADYKNPRNLCSGSVRQLDSSVTARRGVRFVVFDWVNGPDSKPKSWHLEVCKKLGFETVDSIEVNRNNVEEAVQKFSSNISKLRYPSDGLVLTFEDIAYGKSLGVTAKTPKHSIAFKWQDEVAESKLIDIEWQVGRSGVITPVAVFEPVDIEGSTVERASLHNISIIQEVLGQPYVGQKVRVYKSNMIIPQILWGEKLEGY